MPIWLFKAPLDQPLGRRGYRCLGIVIKVRDSGTVDRWGNRNEVAFPPNSEALRDRPSRCAEDEPFRPKEERTGLTIPCHRFEGFLPGLPPFVLHAVSNECGCVVLVIRVDRKDPR